MTCYTPPLPSQSFFWGNSTTNRPWQCCLGWNESQDYQILEISFTGRQKNKSFEYDTGCVLTFISVLSLRMEGGRERGRGGRREGGVHCAVDRIGFVCDEWGCHRRWQVCVQYMWMYNTLCIPWQAGSLFVPMISKSFHLWLLMVNTVTEGRRAHTVGPLEAKKKTKKTTTTKKRPKLLHCFGSDSFNYLFIGPS